MCETVLPTISSKNLIRQLIEEHNFKDVEICVSRGSEKGDNYVGEIYRIKINSKSSNNNLLSVILKTTLPDKNDAIPLCDFYCREAILYNVILPSFDRFQKKYDIKSKEFFKFAKCFKANEEIILLEDLKVRGFMMHNRYNSFDENHLVLTLTSLAQYHAISFAMKEHEPSAYENLTKLVEKNIVGDFFNPMLERISAQTISIVKEKSKQEILTEFSADIVKKFHSYIGPDIAQPYNIICHGDCWNNNILFKYQDGIPDEMIFLDWQASRYSSPVTDIGYMIYCSTDKVIRDKLGSQMFDIYYEALTKQLNYFNCNIKKCYPREIFNDHIKKILPFGLLMGMIVVPIILCEKGKELDLSEMCASNDDNPKDIEYNDISIERLNDMIDEFINLDFI